MSDPRAVLYDLIVVGAGPVGLAAAIEGRMMGLTVLLIEQRAGVIDKACGEGLMPGALPLLQRLGVEVEGRPLRGVTYRQADRSVTHRFADGGGLGVRRTTLYGALGRRADELGVERLTAKVTGVKPTDDRVTVVVNEGDTGGEVAARYLLACDGLHSTVARLTGLARAAPRRSRRYGVRQHYAVAPWGDTIEVYYAARAEFYVTPVTDSVVGIAMLAGPRVDFARALAEVPHLAQKLDGAAPASTRRGAGPFRQRTRARTLGRVLLVGDASGYVDAITGEGLRLGMAQARAAVHCVATNRPRSYERAWRRETRDFRLLTSALVALATSPARGSIVPLAATFPWLFGRIVERLAR
jgi:flavin-dependent dehydrogenase